MLIAVNFFAVLLSAVAAMVVGTVWYSPALFGARWAELRKHSAHHAGETRVSPQSAMLFQFAAALITSFFMAEFVVWLGISGVTSGLLLGLWVWLGFFATTMLDDVLWSGGQWALYLLNISQRLVSLVVMATILSVWR